MNLIEIKDLYENKENFINKEIEVGGWVRSIRVQRLLDLLS